MLARLQGRTHRVITAFYLCFGTQTRERVAETEVVFRGLEAREIDAYAESGEWRGKAGGYAVQGIAAAFVRSISGSYTAVVGLPLCEVLEELEALGALPLNWAWACGKRQ
jgi:septum formation protein